MKQFQRKIEDFTCGHCDLKVKGNGYTNHCPRCLWSKHVDVNPGDRAETCGGMMEPVGLELKKGKYTIKYRCQKCGAEKNNQADEADSVEALIELSKTLAKRAMF